MDLEAVKEELVAGLETLDDGMEPYRMVARAVTQLGAPELVLAYQSYTELHQLYQLVIDRIGAAATPEEVLAAYRLLSPAPGQVEEEEGVIGI